MGIIMDGNEQYEKRRIIKAFSEAQYKTLTDQYPMKKGKHWIEWVRSECPGIESGKKMSLAAGDKFLTRMDTNFREVYGENHGYAKTEFKFHVVDTEGKDLSVLQDHFNIGSEWRSLLQVMYDNLFSRREEGTDNGMYDIFLKHIDVMEALGLKGY